MHLLLTSLWFFCWFCCAVGWRSSNDEERPIDIGRTWINKYSSSLRILWMNHNRIDLCVCVCVCVSVAGLDSNGGDKRPETRDRKQEAGNDKEKCRENRKRLLSIGSFASTDTGRLSPPPPSPPQPFWMRIFLPGILRDSSSFSWRMATARHLIGWWISDWIG